MKQKDFITNYNFKFKKKYGQNFLIDENILNNIVNSVDIDSETLVIEIGCGAGALTKKLVLKTKKVVGYEIDKTLKPILDTISDAKIIFDDFLNRDINKDIENKNYKKMFIVSNLPYYITTPIISKIINDKIDVNKIVIMVQKEVGDRLSAKVNSKDYGSLTVFINYYFKVKKLFFVSKNVFLPKPNVDSVVIMLEKKESKYDLINPNLFFKIVRDSFLHKRKTLKNNLKSYNFEIISNVLSEYGFNDNVRAEQIPMEVFIKIANSLSV